MPRSIATKARRPFSRTSVAIAAVLTLTYWIWESQASGNIRVDLLLFYPVLFSCYLFALWPRVRYWSVPLAVLLMAINFGFFVISYDLFDKNPG